MDAERIPHGHHAHDGIRASVRAVIDGIRLDSRSTGVRVAELTRLRAEGGRGLNVSPTRLVSEW